MNVAECAYAIMYFEKLIVSDIIFMLNVWDPVSYFNTCIQNVMIKIIVIGCIHDCKYLFFWLGILKIFSISDLKYTFSYS